MERIRLISALAVIAVVSGCASSPESVSGTAAHHSLEELVLSEPPALRSHAPAESHTGSGGAPRVIMIDLHSGASRRLVASDSLGTRLIRDYATYVQGHRAEEAHFASVPLDK